MKKPIGIRQNNGGNIRTSPIKWKGELDNSLDHDNRFEEFETPELGIRAIMKLLLTYYRKYGLNTVRSIINRWAPPNNDEGKFENDTGAYQEAVAKKLGVNVDTVINLDDKKTMITLAKSIVAHENGLNDGKPWYSDETYEKAYKLI